jgi:hypothetical protein
MCGSPRRLGAAPQSEPPRYQGAKRSDDRQRSGDEFGDSDDLGVMAVHSAADHELFDDRFGFASCFTDKKTLRNAP